MNFVSSDIWLVAAREIFTKARSKIFIISTIILVLGAVAFAIVISITTRGDDGPEEVSIGLTDFGSPLSSVLTAESDDVFNVSVVEVDDIDADLEDGNVDVVVDGNKLIWKDTSNPGLEIYIRSAIQQVSVAERAERLNIDLADLNQLFVPADVEVEFVDGETDERNLRTGVATIAAIGMFLLLQISGQFVMMGVVEEKASRVVEVLLSRVKPFTLLAGKIFGLGALVLLQAAILVGGLIAALLVTKSVEIPSDVWLVVFTFVPVFLLGYIFYATAFAAVASLVSRQEDLQSVMWPVMLPLLGSYILAISSVGEPDSTIVRITSFVPFTSPIVLPFRMGATSMPLWEVFLALAILVVGAVVMLNLASRIYEGALLRIGTKVGWSEAWKNRSTS